MVVLKWDLETRLGKYDYILEEEEEKRKLMQKLIKQDTNRLIDVDSDCEIW